MILVFDGLIGSSYKKAKNTDIEFKPTYKGHVLCNFVYFLNYMYYQLIMNLSNAKIFLGQPITFVTSTLNM